MINSKMIPSIVASIDPEFVIVGIYDFDSTEWLVSVVKSLSLEMDSSLMYLISKKNGKIRRFFPTQNLKGFHNALKHRVSAI